MAKTVCLPFCKVVRLSLYNAVQLSGKRGKTILTSSQILEAKNRVNFEKERVGTPFPLLKCLRTYYGRHSKPFPSKNALDCRILHIQLHNLKIFPWLIPRTPQKHPRCLDPDTRFQLFAAFLLLLLYKTTTAKNAQKFYVAWASTRTLVGELRTLLQGSITLRCLGKGCLLPVSPRKALGS